jgi:eukaryotic-like serine/threonine-protein kinase
VDETRSHDPAPAPPAPAAPPPGRDVPAALTRDTHAGPTGRPPGEGQAFPEVPGYEVLGVLGHGGMGVVYRARQLRADRVVALKMIRAVEPAGEQDRLRFRIETEAVARLQHPNIVQLYEAGEAAGRPYFSLEFCAGGSLEQRLKTWRPTPAEAARLVEALARAVHYAHLRGVVHRDLKPANVLLDTEGRPKVTDFGLAKRLDAEAREVSRTGAVLGSPSYMAPEQAAGKVRDTGPAADVYALGALFYACLTGRPPFAGATTLDTLHQVLHDEPPPPSRFARVPRDLETICLKCLEKEPERRYADAEALADDLGRFLRGEPVRARPAGRLERAAKWVRRNPAVAALLAAVALALAAGAAVSAYYAAEMAAARDREARRADTEREAREAETRAKAEMQAERDRANEAAYLFNRQRYVSDMRLVQQAWEDRQYDRARELLDGLAPGQTGGKDLRGFEWHYWRRCLDLPLVTIRCPCTDLLATAISADGSRVAVYDHGTGPAPVRVVHVYDTRSGKEVAAVSEGIPPTGGQGPLWCLALSPDGARLAAGSLTSGTVFVWDVAGGRLVHSFAGPRGTIVRVEFTRDGRRLCAIVGGRAAIVGGRARVWDLAAGTELTRPGPPPGLAAVAFYPDGDRVVTTRSDEGGLSVLEANTGKELFPLQGGDDPLWRKDPGAPHLPLLAVSPDGRLIAGVFPGLERRPLQVWDAATGQRRHFHLLSPGYVPRSLAFSADGRLAVTAGKPGVRVWEVATGEEVAVYKADKSGSVNAAFDPAGTRLVSAHLDGTLRTWDARQRQESRILGWHGPRFLCVAYGRDGGRVVSGAEDAAVHFWDPDSGDELATLKVPDPSVRSVALSPDGRRVAAASGSGLVTVWDAGPGTRLASWPAAERSRSATLVFGLAFSPDGRLLASAGTGPTLQLWEPDTGREAFRLEHAGWDEPGWVRCVAYGPDGTRIATGGEGEARVWDAETRQVTATLRGHQGQVNAVAFSPDGRRVVTGGSDGLVRVWDAGTGRELFTLRGHTDGVSAVAFFPDGTRIVSASGVSRRQPPDNTVRVWDAELGQELLTLRGHTEWISGVAVSPDGRRIVSASWDGTLRLWDSSPPPRP